MKYFGTDGIRGKVHDFINFDLAYRVGQSLASLNVPIVIIGKDTRESGTLLADGIASGAKSVGINVCDIGIVSTPLLSYVSGRLQAIGVMITASHNPYTDNGIKVFCLGKKLFSKQEQLLEDYLSGVVTVIITNSGIDLAVVRAFDMYLDLFSPIMVKTSMKIVIDCANGSNYRIAPSIFSRITDKLIITGANPNGQNINLDVGSTHLDNIINLIIKNEFDYGFAFDGDGDRLIVVDGNGRIFDGDMLIYITAIYLKQHNALKDSTVVLTKMSNLGIIKAFKMHGINPILTDVGDKFVLEAMENGDYTLGGENSGHIINRTLLNTGDGALNAAYLVKIMEETGMSLAELSKDVIMYPDKMVNLKNVNKQLLNHPDLVTLVDEWKLRLGDKGKILVRASGTEPLVRISVSAESVEILEKCQNQIVDLLKRLNRQESHQ
ncbi:MAG: hypothetical protein WC296_01295 [Candidatus Izemoplasmatales bacterium]|jgi:phosphoglucosamine mutase